MNICGIYITSNLFQVKTMQRPARVADLSSFLICGVLPLVEGVLGVEDREHALVEMAEEFPQCLFEIHVAVLVIGLQVLEEIRENVRVAFVEDPVGLLEHEVEVPLRVGEQLSEEF